MRRRTKIFGGIAIVLLAGVVLWQAITPSNRGTWIAGQDRMPAAVVSGDTVTLRDVRNFTYRSATDFDPLYEDRTVKLSDVQSTWYVIDQLDDSRGAAHTFLSFGFKDGTYLSVSVEARREVGEDYSIYKGMLKKYELLYVLADEMDVIRLRADIRNHPVRLYKLALTPAQSQDVFRTSLERINDLVRHPEFYNTITNACATNSIADLRTASGVTVSSDWRAALPGYSDELFTEDGLIETADINQLRDASLINEAVKTAPSDSKGFSAAIRENLPN